MLETFLAVYRRKHQSSIFLCFQSLKNYTMKATDPKQWGLRGSLDAYSLGAYSLGAYDLGAYGLGPPILYVLIHLPVLYMAVSG